MTQNSWRETDIFVIIRNRVNVCLSYHIYLFCIFTSRPYNYRL